VTSTVLAAIALAACKGDPSTREIQEWAARNEKVAPPPLIAEHVGAGIARGDSGTARFARLAYESFAPEHALEIATFVDGYDREPANEGYDAVIDRVEHELRAVGFGKDPRLTLEIIASRVEPQAWTPRRARLSLRVPGEAEIVLHEFAKAGDGDRTMLPRNAPSANVEGDIVLDLEDVRPGSILATKSSLTRGFIERARSRGAMAAISASLAPFNVDGAGHDRHLDAIQYRVVDPGCTLPVAQISPHALSAIEDAVRKNRAARIAFEAEVDIAARPLRTVVATIVGDARPELAVALVAHVQEPGACDNASGVATLLEGARELAGNLTTGALPWPQKSLVFVWGNEMEESRVLLEKSSREFVAAIAADMTGESESKTGAVALLERAPDPGAITALDPDEHTAWGAGTVDAKNLKPSGLAIVARSALIDLGGLVPGWKTREHPFEGGSDHVVFIEKGIPAVLFWHFTDFAYHTSLDRIDHVDAEEMHRTGAAILCTALALADAKPNDLDRYLQSLRAEADLRLGACQQKGDEALAGQWREWFKGARLWLRELCLGAPSAKPPSVAPPESTHAADPGNAPNARSSPAAPQH
jgi:hypothetical protein